nr:uncharacterized protein LOC111517823 [Leptinotarsa decemlineata]
MDRYRSHEVHNYPEESLKNALHAIRVNNLGIREASRKYGVPRGTIQDRLHGRVKEGPRKMGPSKVLTGKEEDELLTWLLELEKCGFPQRKQDLLNVVEEIVSKDERKNPFKNNKPEETWYQSFLKRHKNIALRKAEGLSKSRAIITEESIRKWFREFTSKVLKHLIF